MRAINVEAFSVQLTLGSREKPRAETGHPKAQGQGEMELKSGWGWGHKSGGLCREASRHLSKRVMGKP